MATAKAQAAAHSAASDAHDAELTFLKAALQKLPLPSDDAQSIIPSGPPPPTVKAAPSAMPGKLQAAVRKLGMATRLGSAPGRYSRRENDPREHLTVRHAGGDFVAGDDADAATAAVFKRQTPTPTGKIMDEVARTRRGVSAAQELSNKLRWGVAGSVADMSDVPIGDVGARLLSFTLPKARALAELRLARSGVGDGGALYMCTALRCMTTLRHVDMRECEIGTKGAVALAGAIEVGCVGVHTFLLGSNRFGAAGCAALAAALPGNRSLTRFDLERTGAGMGMVPLFARGDSLSFEGDGTVVHERTGRSVARADGADPASLVGARCTLVSFRSEIGLLIELTAAAKPPRKAAVINVGTNSAVEALVAALGMPMTSLRHLHLSGNFGTPTRKYLSKCLAAGPNASSLTLLFDHGSTAGDAASAEAEEHAKEMAAIAASVVPPLDAGIAIAAHAKLWVPGRPGDVPPEPSECSAASIDDEAGAAGGDGAARTLSGMFGDDGEDDDELLDEAIRETLASPLRMSLGTVTANFGDLERSQTMSKSQNTVFALSGARVGAQVKPPEGGVT